MTALATELTALENQLHPHRFANRFLDPTARGISVEIEAEGAVTLASAIGAVVTVVGSTLAD